MVFSFKDFGIFRRLEVRVLRLGRYFCSCTGYWKVWENRFSFYFVFSFRFVVWEFFVWVVVGFVRFNGVRFSFFFVCSFYY